MSLRPDSASGGGAAQAARRRTPAYLLEHSQNVVTDIEDDPEHFFEVAPCGCDCWYCPRCCIAKGYRLRSELIPVLETFRGLMMVTLTIDPELFESPKRAYLHVREKRAISRLVGAIDQAGYLFSHRYFCVVEFQQHTEQPHFHLLLDSNFVPKIQIDATWSRFRPKSAGPVKANRPQFGMTRFSMPNFEGGAVHAARYATKYLVKTPDYGYPGWVMAMGSEMRVPRYSTSRGFWGREPKPANPNPKPREMTRRSYAEKVQDCGETCNVFESTEEVDRETGEVTRHKAWRGRVDLSADQLRQVLEEESEGRRRLRVIAENAPSMVDALQAAAGLPVEVVSGYRMKARPE